MAVVVLSGMVMETSFRIGSGRRKIHVLKRDIVGFGMLRLALFVHLRDLIHLVGVVDGASYQTQGGYAAARGFDLRKDQESHNDRHQALAREMVPFKKNATVAIKINTLDS